MALPGSIRITHISFTPGLSPVKSGMDKIAETVLTVFSPSYANKYRRQNLSHLWLIKTVENGFVDFGGR